MRPYYPVLDKHDFHRLGRPSSFERETTVRNRLCGIAYTSAGGQS